LADVHYRKPHLPDVFKQHCAFGGGLINLARERHCRCACNLRPRIPRRIRNGENRLPVIPNTVVETLRHYRLSLPKCCVIFGRPAMRSRS